MVDVFELIRQKCLNKVSAVSIKDFCEVGTGSSNGNEAIENGDYPFYVRSETVFRKNDYEFDEIAIVIPGEGGIGEVFHYVEGKYALHQRAYRIHAIKDDVFMKYVYYYMRAYFKEYIIRQSVDGTVASIRKPMIEKFVVPLPPLLVQREIVAILDKFDAYCNDMTAGLAGELEMRRKQYRYWANTLIMEGNVQMVKLGNLCKICKGEQLNKDDYTEGPYPVWNMGAEPSGTHDTYNRDVPSIVIAGHGNSVGTVNWVDEPFWAGGGCYYLDGFADGLSDRYLFHALKARERSLMGLASDGPIRDLYPRTIARAQVPVPVSVSGTGAWDAARQQFICDILDKLCELERELEHELELRRKQYEYYRDMLLSFPERKESA